MIRIVLALLGLTFRRPAAAHRGDAVIAAGLTERTGSAPSNGHAPDHLAHNGGWRFVTCKRHGLVTVVRHGAECPECILDVYFASPPGAVEGGPPDVTPAPGVSANVAAAQQLFTQHTRQK